MTTLEYFGKLLDFTGVRQERIELPGFIANTSDLRRWLDEIRQLTDVFQDPSIRIAINDEICSDPNPIHQGDRIAFLPPVGGG